MTSLSSPHLLDSIKLDNPIGLDKVAVISLIAVEITATARVLFCIDGDFEGSKACQFQNWMDFAIHSGVVGGGTFFVGLLLRHYYARRIAEKLISQNPSN